MLTDLLFEMGFVLLLFIVSPFVFVSNSIEWMRLPEGHEDRERCWRALKLSGLGVLIWVILIMNCLRSTSR